MRVEGCNMEGRAGVEDLFQKLEALDRGLSPYEREWRAKLYV